MTIQLANTCMPLGRYGTTIIPEEPLKKCVLMASCATLWL